MIGIYKITSPSGRIYIGQSRDIQKRKKCYTPGRCKNQKLINNSLRKYGYKNHLFEIVYIFPEDVKESVVDNFEIFCYEQYRDSGIKMLNLKECGNGGGKHTDSTKLLIGKQSKERFKAKLGYEIYQYDLNLNLIQTWKDSMLDISKSSGVSGPNLSRSLTKNELGKINICSGYFWFYQKDLEKIQEIDLKRIILKKNQYGNHYMYL